MVLLGHTRHYFVHNNIWSDKTFKSPWLQPKRLCVKMTLALGRRQVVRQRVLVPSFAGSIPAGPAIFDMKTKAVCHLARVV